MSFLRRFISSKLIFIPSANAFSRRQRGFKIAFSIRLLHLVESIDINLRQF